MAFEKSCVRLKPSFYFSICVVAETHNAIIRQEKELSVTCYVYIDTNNRIKSRDLKNIVVLHFKWLQPCLRKMEVYFFFYGFFRCFRCQNNLFC